MPEAVVCFVMLMLSRCLTVLSSIQHTADDMSHRAPASARSFGALHSAERVQVERPRTSTGSRSSSHKKVTSSSRSGSEKKKSTKKKPAWDDTNHDLSVHKLPKQKQLEKQLQMLSREQLTKIAGMELPQPQREAAILHAISSLSPPVHRRSSSTSRTRSSSHMRTRSRSPTSFASPRENDSSHSSAASTPESHLRDEDSASSYASTPSPPEQRMRHQHSAPQMLVAKPQVPKQTRAVKREAAPPATQHPAPMMRHSVAPVITSAPPSAEQSEDEVNDSFSIFAPAPGASQSSSAPQYSPWLKANHMLSPVLERSQLENSAASTPNVPQAQQKQGEQIESQPLDRPFFTDLQDSNAPSVVSSPLRPAAASNARAHTQTQAPNHSAERSNSGRNLINELRQSMEHPQQYQQQSSPQSHQTLSSMPLPTLQHFMSLMSQVVSHMSERESLTAAEAQFKSNTVASLSGTSAQLKALTQKVEDAERDSRAIKAAAMQAQVEHEKEVRELKQQLRMMEYRIEQMEKGLPQRVSEQQQQQPTLQKAANLSNEYDPSLYHSQRPSTAAQRDAAPRAPSPPRPIIINHTNTNTTSAAQIAALPRTMLNSIQHAQQQQQAYHQQQQYQQPAVSGQSFNGARTSEVNVHVQGDVKAARNGSHSVVPVVASHKVAWQTYSQQQQQHQQPQQLPHMHIQSPPSQQVKRAQSPHRIPGTQMQQTSAHPAFQSRSLLRADEDEQEDEARSDDDLVAEQPRFENSNSMHGVTPFSPSSEQDEEEARQFAAQAARMRAAQASFGQAPIRR